MFALGFLFWEWYYYGINFDYFLGWYYRLFGMVLLRRWLQDS